MSEQSSLPLPILVSGERKFKRRPVADNSTPWANLQPGEWCGDPLPEPYSGVGWGFARCPSGHFGTLTAKHSLDPNGSKLTPSYVCPEPGCSFHEFVLLGRRIL